MVNSDVLRVHRDGLSEGMGSGPPCDTTSMMWLVGRRPWQSKGTPASRATRERACARSAACVYSLGGRGCLCLASASELNFLEYWNRKLDKLRLISEYLLYLEE